MQEIPLTFKSKGQQIVGVLHLPEKKSKAPLLIICHGWSGDMLGSWGAFFVKTARVLAKNGFASLRFDFRGSGNSEGLFENQTITSMLEDLKNVINQVSQREEIDKEKIALAGHSQGGYISLLYAARDKRIKTIILWMGRTADLKDFWSNTSFQESERRGYLVTGDFKTLNRKYVRDSKKYNSEAALRKIKIPIGMVYGNSDEIVLPSEGLRVKNYSKGKTDMKILEELNHDFSGEKNQKRIQSYSLSWLKKWM